MNLCLQYIIRIDSHSETQHPNADNVRIRWVSLGFCNLRFSVKLKVIFYVEFSVISRSTQPADESNQCLKIRVIRVIRDNPRFGQKNTSTQESPEYASLTGLKSLDTTQFL